MFFFAVEGDSLVDRTSRPELLPSFAYSMLLGERPRAASDALDLALERAPGEHRLLYWRAWARWATGDSAGAKRDLIAAGLRPERGLPPATRASLVAGDPDTSAWLARLGRARDAAALDPWVHGRLAAVGLAAPDGRPTAVIEAFAYRTLDPGDPDAWRKWAAAQLAERRYDVALASLETYLRLAGPRGDEDLEARRVVAQLRDLVRGDASRRAVRN